MPLKEIKLHFLLALVFQFAITSTYFLFTFTFSWNTLYIIFCHVGIYFIITILFIISSVLTRKYLRAFHLPISFLQFIISYKFYLNSFSNMCNYLVRNHSGRTTVCNLDITFFAHINYLYFIITAWALSIYIYPHFKNLNNIFSSSKNR